MWSKVPKHLQREELHHFLWLIRTVAKANISISLATGIGRVMIARLIYNAKASVVS